MPARSPFSSFGNTGQRGDFARLRSVEDVLIGEFQRLGNVPFDAEGPVLPVDLWVGDVLGDVIEVGHRGNDWRQLPVAFELGELRLRIGVRQLSPGRR